MQRRLLCERIVALVAQVTDLSVEEIMSHSKRSDIVDARYIAVYVMLQQGICPYYVAEYMDVSSRNIYHVQERFDNRKIYGNVTLGRYYNSVLKAMKQQ